MAKLVLSRHIEAQPQAVFAYVLAYPNYHWMFRTPRLNWTGPYHQVGSKLKMEIRLAGAPVDVEFQTTDILPYAKIAGVIDAGRHGEWEWRVESAGDGTDLTLVVGYELGMGPFGLAVDKLAVERGLRRDLNWTMDHIKKFVEGQRSGA